MSDVSTTLRWTGEGLAFDASFANGTPSFTTDSGGRAGASPVQLVLVGLAGCTGIDIVDIVGKMRVAMSGLEVVADARRAEDPPRRLTHVHLTYRAAGVAAADVDKVRRAIELSEQKYCSVWHSLRPDLEITTELELV